VPGDRPREGFCDPGRNAREMSSQLSPPSPFIAAEELGESPWPPALAVIAAALLYATLPGRFVAGSSAGVFGAARWVVPALTLVLLVPFLALPRQRAFRLLGEQIETLRLTNRITSLAIVGVVSLANAASIALLVHALTVGVGANARLLLQAAIHMWCTNVLVFALWYWQLDGHGPAGRTTRTISPPDFLFPQQSDPTLAPAGWRPNFVDYLYVSFTNATAFSPTDTVPLSRWAKMLMLVQAAASLLLAVMVAARAVNILQ